MRREVKWRVLRGYITEGEDEDSDGQGALNMTLLSLTCSLLHSQPQWLIHSLATEHD